MSQGVVQSLSGFGWCCLVCRELECSPLDLSDDPAMAVIDGSSICLVHLPIYEEISVGAVLPVRRVRIQTAAMLARERGLPRTVQR